MWQAIAAVFGLATSANQGAQAQYAGQRAEYAQSLGFSEAKDMAFYNAYQASTRNILIAAVIGFAFLGLIVFLALRNK